MHSLSAAIVGCKSGLTIIRRQESVGLGVRDFQRPCNASCSIFVMSRYQPLYQQNVSVCTERPIPFRPYSTLNSVPSPIDVPCPGEPGGCPTGLGCCCCCCRCCCRCCCCCSECLKLRYEELQVFCPAFLIHPGFPPFPAREERKEENLLVFLTPLCERNIILPCGYTPPPPTFSFSSS